MGKGGPARAGPGGEGVLAGEDDDVPVLLQLVRHGGGGGRRGSAEGGRRARNIPELLRQAATVHRLPRRAAAVTIVLEPVPAPPVLHQLALVVLVVLVALAAFQGRQVYSGRGRRRHAGTGLGAGAARGVAAAVHHVFAVVLGDG